MYYSWRLYDDLSLCGMTVRVRRTLLVGATTKDTSSQVCLSPVVAERPRIDIEVERALFVKRLVATFDVRLR
jgi:hypothetical protein